MGELERQRGFKVCENLGRTNWEKFAAEASGDDAESDIDNAVDYQDPQRREMPQQRTRQPVAESDLPREDKVKQGRRVVYLPAGTDHHEYRQGIDPVTDAYPARVNCRASLCRGDCSGGHCGLFPVGSTGNYGAAATADARHFSPLLFVYRALLYHDARTHPHSSALAKAGVWLTVL